MSFRSGSGNILRQSSWILVLLALAAFSWGQQKKTSSPPPSKPSAPQHASAPPAQHSSAPSHPSNTAGAHTGAQAGSHTTTGAHTGTTSGTHTGNTTGGTHNGTMGGAHNGTTGGTHAGTGTNGKGPANGTNNKGPAGKGSANGVNAKGAGGANGGKGSANTANARGPHTPPGKQVSLKGGGSASIRPNGQIRSVNRNGMHIEHGVRGDRRVVSNRNGVRVVSNGRRGGYVQRAYVTRGGRSYYSRTYYHNGVYVTGVYRGYYYGGSPYYGYYPAYYYQPAYYGWAYNPWPAPVAYGWGWGGSPWYGYYGAYYQPYPVYPSAAFWLTDFLVAASLQAAYEAQANALLYPNAADGTLVASLLPIAAAGSDAVKMSPEVKKALADEVKTQLAAEQSEAGKGKSSSGAPPATSNEAPPALDPNFRMFVVNTDLTLVVDGEECALSEGDVITRTTDTPDDDKNVNVKVAASNKSDCAVGKEGPVAVDDLQEMYNHFRDQLKDGMGELAKKQGTGGLPKAPDTSTTAGDVPPPAPDKTVEKSLQDQQTAADQTESEVKQEAGSGSGGGAQ
jgi:hypothetical protein